MSTLVEFFSQVLSVFKFKRRMTHLNYNKNYAKYGVFMKEIALFRPVSCLEK